MCSVDFIQGTVKLDSRKTVGGAGAWDPLESRESGRTKSKGPFGFPSPRQSSDGLGSLGFDLFLLKLRW